MSVKLQWPKWEGVVIGFILAIVVAFALFVLVKNPDLFKYNELNSNSAEGIEARELRFQRYLWLEDGCPQPPVAAKYVQLVGGDKNYSFTGTLAVSNFLGDANHIFHGLFATKLQGWTRTLVITTTGDIFAVEDSGEERLLEWEDFQGNLQKPQAKK